MKFEVENDKPKSRKPQPEIPSEKPIKQDYGKVMSEVPEESQKTLSHLPAI